MKKKVKKEITEYPKTKEEKLARFKTLARSQNKKAGETVITFGSDMVKTTKTSIGVPEIDNLLGGGIPDGRIITVWGDKGCLSEDTLIKYSTVNNGKIKNKKPISIKRLYYNFKGENYDDSKTYYRKELLNKNFYLNSIDEKKRIVRNLIINIVDSGTKKVYEITTLSGKKIQSTLDHKYLNEFLKYVPLSTLKIGDEVYTNQNKNNVSGGERKYYPEKHIKYHPYGILKILNKKYKYYRCGISRLVVEADLNNVSYNKYIALLNTAPKSFLKKLKYINPKIYDIHHRDKNPENNLLMNLLVVTKKEHQKIHYKDIRENPLYRIVNLDRIIAINYIGKKHTYDISMLSPYNNFLAQNFVVHNCGKTSAALEYVVQSQNAGKVCYYIALEKLDRERMEEFGVNLDELMIGEFPKAEMCLDSILEHAEAQSVDVIILDSIHCYDKETMVLTNQGWKLFKDLSGKELILSLNKDNETTKYVKISKIIKHHHTGKMYKYEGKHCNFCMTENNRILFGNPSHKYKFTGWMIKTIKEVVEKWKYNYFLLKKNFIWSGKNKKFITISGKKRIDRADITTYKINSKIWCQFMGWWLSEGSSGFKIYKHSRQKQCVAVKIHQSLKSPFLKDIEDVLNQLPFIYKKHIYNNEVTYVINNSLLGRYLMDICIADKNILYDNKHRGAAKIKKIPQYIKDLSPNLLEFFLDAYYKGDGWLSWGGNKCISTSSYQMSLDLKEIYLKCGQYVNITTEKIPEQKKWIIDHWANLGGVHYTLTPYSNNIMTHSILRKNIKTVDYDDFIYDVEIDSESHLIYLMRKGTSYWASNSLSPEAEQVDKNGKTKSLSNENMALLARKLSEFFRRANHNLSKGKITLFLIGQTRIDLGGFIKLEKLTGGNALKHYSKLILHMRHGQGKNAPVEHQVDINGDGHTVKIGFECVVKIDKTQVSGTENEGSEVRFPFFFDGAFVQNKKEKLEEIKSGEDSDINVNLKEEIKQIGVDKPKKKKRGRPTKKEK